MARHRLIILLLLSVATCFGDDTADDNAYEGNALYKKGDFLGAVKQYEEAKKLQPDRLAIDFNMGNAYYRQKEYAKAAATHKNASGSENALLSAESHYNVGNSRFREGAEGKLKKIVQGATDKAVLGDKAPSKQDTETPDKTRKWEKALSAYRSAIELVARDESDLAENAKQALEDARANYEFVKHKLDQEKQNQPQQGKQKSKSGGGGGSNQEKQQDKGDKDQEKKQPQDKQQQGGGKDKDKNKDKDQQQPKPQQDNQDKQKQKQQPRPQPRDTQTQEQEQQQPMPAPKMTKEQAEDLLGRLRNDQEEHERKKREKAKAVRKRRIVKDW